MLKNYLTIALRHLTRHKLFSVINMFCLAIGITFALLIGIYVMNEEGVNARLRNIHNQYVIKSRWKQENMGLDITTLGPLAKTIRDEYPSQVANFYRFDAVVNLVSVGTRHFRTQIAAGDTSFVSMYGFRLVHGNPTRAFRNNLSAVVTEAFARKFFDRTDVVGQTISIQTPADGGSHDFIITAVLQDMPRNSVTHFVGPPFEVYLPMDANQYFQGGDKGDNWSNVFMVSLIELKKGVDAKDLDKSLARVLEKYQPPFVKGNLQAFLVPLGDYYLDANNGAVKHMLSTLSLVALFILILAVINFVNISIGTAAHRLKEIGLRKVFGGYKRQIIVQHVTESMMLSLAAALLSLLGYEAIRSFFAQLLQTSFQHFWQFSFLQGYFLLTLVLTLGVISGFYPAFVLSSAPTVLAVKGKFTRAMGRMRLRKTLLVFQFALVIMVFICSMNVSRQVSYIFNKDLGYDKEQVMIISSLPRQWDSAGVIRMENRKNNLLEVPGVKNASLSYDIPDGNGGGYVNIDTLGNASHFISMQIIGADADFAKVYDIRLQEGHFLTPFDARPVQGQVVLNETAMKALGWESAAGNTIRMGGVGCYLLRVVGVIRDFHLESVQKTIQPTLIASLNEPFTRSYRYLSVKLDTRNLSSTIDALQVRCKTLFPEAGFDYSFMDEKYQAIYKTELQIQKASRLATVLNLVIVFLGLFGVLAFTLSQRTQEMAVRKVLGAAWFNLVGLFVKEYGLLILIANVIAWPIAFVVTQRWLENYAYRIDQGVLTYLLVSVLVFASSFFLITVQSLKATLVNPVNQLRME